MHAFVRVCLCVRVYVCMCTCTCVCACTGTHRRGGEQEHEGAQEHGRRAPREPCCPSLTQVRPRACAGFPGRPAAVAGAPRVVSPLGQGRRHRSPPRPHSSPARRASSRRRCWAFLFGDKEPGSGSEPRSLRLRAWGAARPGVGRRAPDRPSAAPPGPGTRRSPRPPRCPLPARRGPRCFSTTGRFVLRLSWARA